MRNCAGSPTLTALTRGKHSICKICFWEINSQEQELANPKSAVFDLRMCFKYQQSRGRIVKSQAIKKGLEL